MKRKPPVTLRCSISGREPGGGGGGRRSGEKVLRSAVGSPSFHLNTDKFQLTHFRKLDLL